MKNKEQHTDNEFLSEETLLLYKAGKLSPSEMRRVERLLEKYPLYAEALEGLELLAENKAQESINLLKQYAEKQVFSTSATKIVPLQKNNLVRVAAAVTVLLFASFGFYYAFNNSAEKSMTAQSMETNSNSATPPQGSANETTPPQYEEAEAANREEDLMRENQLLEKESSAIVKQRQEAQPSIQGNKSAKPTDMIADSIGMLALKSKENRLQETSANESVLAEKDIDDEKTSGGEKEEKAITAVKPAPVEQSSPINPLSATKDEPKNDDKLTLSDAQESKKLSDERKRLSNAKKKEAGQEAEKQGKASSTTSGNVTAAEESLKNTLKQQLLDLAKAQNETLKGKFVAKITLRQSGKVRQVTVQEMPCKSCKTNILIETIEKHQFADSKEKIIEIVF
jgi:hypothetical protein